MFFKQVILFFKARKQDKVAAAQLYQTCCQCARAPALYQSFNIADTLQNRFELITAHLWLVMKNLKAHNATALIKNLATLFFSEMDATLREAGEGDLAVPKRMKKFAQAFYGRLRAYDKANKDKAASNIADNLSLKGQYASNFNAYFTALDKQLATLPLNSYYKGSNLFNQNYAQYAKLQKS